MRVNVGAPVKSKIRENGPKSVDFPKSLQLRICKTALWPEAGGELTSCTTVVEDEDPEVSESGSTDNIPGKRELACPQHLMKRLWGIKPA